MTYRIGAQRWRGAIAATITLALVPSDAAPQKVPRVQAFRAEITFECRARCPPGAVSELQIVPASRLLIVEHASAAGPERRRRLSVFFLLDDAPQPAPGR